MTNNSSAIQKLYKTVIACQACPRLVKWREEVARTKVSRFIGENYWGKAVPGFGDPKARLLIIGLAPAAHGANRTGRMFTGDRSGDWLYRALYKAGFANQPESISRNDGLTLKDCYITASARCAPPQNKPLPKELMNCRPFLLKELELLVNVRVVIALGKVAADTIFDTFRASGRTAMKKRPAFGHGIQCELNEHQTLITSFHPSQQNTFTGKLTESMFDEIFSKAKSCLIKKSKGKSKK